MYYDPDQDKIIGAKKESLVYYHEEGHRLFMYRGYTAVASVLNQILYLLCLAYLVNQSYLEARIVLLVICAVIGFEEVFCWIYAINKKREINKNYVP